MSKQYVLQQMLFSILADGEHELIFRKADDSHRVMLATRDTVLIEVAEKGDKAFTATEPEEKKERKESNILNVVVYDLEAKAWRSFRVDRLVSINGTGMATLASLIGAQHRNQLKMGHIEERYVSTESKGYVNFKSVDPDELSDMVENSSRFELLSDEHGTNTWFLVEDESNF
ncbi:tail fiber protein [Aeromonas phage phiAS4]|uniref:Uncharacterized protein n=2 Tax=Tulanevirus TaxID=2560244 RepID=E1A1B9_9CAUD|nr:tail fiber protein [Aeromonas phage phiAS4]YP_009217599.1 tail fiber protein [Stenotrophomonas phage IME13]ADM79643.1 hypothetical protein phiAS4_ORF0071 [Aeromonas phage phiAS4]AFQ22679.1 tail fiber protein [Stenotrophomonas phage IME13]